MKYSVRSAIAFMVIVFVVMTSLWWYFKGSWFMPEKQDVTIFFENVNGLKAGDPVTLFGQPVGTVTALKQATGGVHVQLAIDSGIILFADAKGVILLRELMSGKQVALTPGTAGTIPYQSGQILSGEPTYDFSTTLQKVGQLTDALNLQALARTINNVDTLSTQLKTQLNQLDLIRLTNNIDRLTQQLSRVLQTVEAQQLVSNLSRTLNNINLLTDSLTVLTSNKNPLWSDARGLIASLQTTTTLLDTTLIKINGLLTATNNRNTLIGTALGDTTLKTELKSTVNKLNATLDYLREKKVRVYLSLQPPKE